MTVAELIELLKTANPDAEVVYPGGEYRDDYREIDSARAGAYGRGVYQTNKHIEEADVIILR